jgi:hypothetical protein
VAGAIFAPVAYFIISSEPLTAVGLSAVMIGFACLALANTRPYLSPEACQLMLQTGMENTSALLEELGLRNKAVYLPASLRNGHSQALIPLVEAGEVQQVKDRVPGRLIVRYGPNPDDMAVAVTTAGSMNLDMLEARPGPTAAEIEAAASYILVGVLDIASAVAVKLTDTEITAEVSRPRLHYEDVWYYRCLGSPVASIVAAISCEALQKAVRIREETLSKGKSRIALEVIS